MRTVEKMAIALKTLAFLLESKPVLKHSLRIEDCKWRDLSIKERNALIDAVYKTIRYKR